MGKGAGFSGCVVRYVFGGVRRDGEIREENRRNGWRKHSRHMRDGAVFLDAEHAYVLKVGDTKTPIKRKMLGRTAKDLNAELEKRFMHELDKGLPNGDRPRLHRWCLDA